MVVGWRERHDPPSNVVGRAQMHQLEQNCPRAQSQSSLQRPSVKDAAARAMASLSRQRWLTFFSMFIGWSFYYFTRKCFVSTMGDLRKDRGFTLDQLGTIASSFSLSYGISKFLSALLSDVASSKIMFSSGLGVCGICVIVFPLCPSSLLCCVVWAIAGLLQGFGWPACAKLLKAWYPPERVGTWWSVLSSSGNLAAAISPLFITYISQFTDWETSYYIMGSGALVLSLLFLTTITDSPEEPIQADTVQKQQSQGVSYFQLFQSLELLAISGVYFMLYVTKGAVCDWTLLYFTEHTNMSSPSGAYRSFDFNIHYPLRFFFSCYMCWYYAGWWYTGQHCVGIYV